MNENRALIDRVKPVLASKGYSTEGAVATQGYLALLSSIQGTVNSVSFTVPANQGTTRSIENRLQITDMFTISHWSLYLLKAGATTAATDAELSVARPRTWPNPLVFTGASEAANLEAVYNGSLRVSVDREIVVDSYDTRRFYRAGVAQELVQQTVTASVGVWQRDEWQGPNYGFAALDPEVTINGVGDTQITLTLPTSINLAGTSSQNFVYLVLRGIRWQNVSKLNR